MAKPLRIAFFLITALLFAISTVFAVLTWSAYKASLVPYTATPCRVDSFNVIACSPDSYRVLANVSLSLQSTPRLASFFPNPSPCGFASDLAAKEAVEARTDRNCYDGPAGLSLTLPLAINSARVRAVLAILCSLVCGAALTSGVYHRCRRAWRPARRSNPYYPHDAFQPRAPAPALYGARGAGAGAGGAAQPLSAAETGVLVAALRARAKAPRAEQTCAICLDDVEDGMRLPCAHEFHEACVTQWLRKGGAACPCCKYDLRIEVRALREKAVRDTVGREERGSGEGGGGGEAEAEAEAEAEGEAASWASWGSYVWGWSWWARDEGEQTESEVSVEYGEEERGGVPP